MPTARSNTDSAPATIADGEVSSSVSIVFPMVGPISRGRRSSTAASDPVDPQPVRMSAAATAAVVTGLVLRAAILVNGLVVAAFEVADLAA
jgi:hypothetical protein